MKGRIAIRIIIISTVFAILLFLYSGYTLLGSVSGSLARWGSFLYVLMAVVCGAVFIHFTLSFVKKRLPAGSLPGIQLISRLGISILIFPVLAGLLIWIFKSLFYPLITWNEVFEIWSDLATRSLILSIFTGIVYAITDHSLDAYSSLQEMQVEASRIRTQQMNLRFESLRNQISPHFLFNSLNTISSLIHRDTRTADTFIRHLAHLYRSVMHHYDAHTITLQEELRLVRDYAYLMQTRFEDAFSLEIGIDNDTGSWHLPPLSVQILVENAVKHNQLSMDRPLQVSVFIEEDTLVVRNNYIGEPGHVRIGKDLLKKPDQGGSGGLGLKNLENRYAYLTRKKMRIVKDEYFTVFIPLLAEKHEQVISG